MTAAGNGKPGSYSVDLSGELKQQIVQLGLEAAQLGILDRFKAALAKVWHRLETDPLEFGESAYGLKHLQLALRIAVVLPLAVHFAVHEEKRFVVIQRIILLNP